MPYPINQRAHQFNSIQSVPVSFGLWEKALKFLSPGPRNDVTDHLEITVVRNLHEAYDAAEKRFGEKHIMSYHNQVYITKSAALFVFVPSLEA